jgi:5'-3' exonuclease
VQALRREEVQVRLSLLALSCHDSLSLYQTQQYIVAPYEADPQLAYLERIGLVDGIISEDSDLLVFGCRQVLFKLDGEGNCVGIARDDFTKCREYNFAGWTEKEFRQMAILSGCDYLESIQGVGLKTAYRLLRKYKTAEKVRSLPSLSFLTSNLSAELTSLSHPTGHPIHPSRRST